MSPKKIKDPAQVLNTAAATIVAREYRPPLTEHVNLAVDPELTALIDQIAEFLRSPSATQQRSNAMRILFEMGAAAFLAERLCPREYRAMRNAVLGEAHAMLDGDTVPA